MHFYLNGNFLLNKWLKTDTYHNHFEFVPIFIICMPFLDRLLGIKKNKSCTFNIIVASALL